MKMQGHIVVAALWLSLFPSLTLQSAMPDREFIRKEARAALKQGNFKEALEGYQALAVDPAEKAEEVPSDLLETVNCLTRLNRLKEADLFRELVVQVHSTNWLALKSAADSWYDGSHYGAIVAGQFERGPHRGQGRIMNANERDRGRALQLMVRAANLIEHAPQSPSQRAYGAFYQDFARMLLGPRHPYEAWKLQVLTDLTQLPDYEDGYGYYGYGETRGAPVDESNNPVFYPVPASFEQAANDGERWRWMLMEAAAHDASLSGSVGLAFADFLAGQFGVETLSAGGWLFPRSDEEGDQRAEITSLDTLSDAETIARLATGVRRFKLPGEFNPILLYQQLARDRKSGVAEQALDKLAAIYTNRRQYDRAADCWRQGIREYGAGSDRWRQKQLDQIVDNWGRFEPAQSRPAGTPVTFEYRFRNASKVTFDARAIKVADLLTDIKAYLKSNPKQLEWDRMSLDNIGYVLVEKNRVKYLGDEVARWELSLTPREHHFDRLVTVQSPLRKAGAYLVTATLANGNTSKIIVWINDTVVARKNLEDKAWFYVADALSGVPLPKMTLDFFGYRQEWMDGRNVNGRSMNIRTSEFAESSDADGQVAPSKKDYNPDYQWLVTATGDGGRLAYLGFSGIWYGSYYDQEYNQRKVFGITDRPVYRPDQTVKFKFWIRHAQYDQEENSDFAGQMFWVTIRNPQGDKVLEKSFKSDAFAGLDGELKLPHEAALGIYQCSIAPSVDGEVYGGCSFRVEEYKKPEFEVTVEAPKDPVQLGETVTALVKAKYYFGSPVTKARVKVKVTRSSYTANWYPVMPWDWFYGPGYWWFAADYVWYPGWREWGCCCPRWWWWPESRSPPELVADTELKLDADGSAKLPIDTALAAALHGDTDHQYQITAEVTDESRRTIVGQGTVLVSRKPFKVHVWVDRGHYRPGDVVRVGLAARRLDGKPVQGQGKLTLFGLHYENGKPVEKVVQKWDLETNEEGFANLQVKASAAGQYRLSATIDDGRRHIIEGAYLFVVRGEGFDGRQYRFSELELVPDQREYRPGDSVKLMVNTDHPGATILLFVRPANGIYLPPKMLRLAGKSTLEEIGITKRDMPNCFVEAITVFDGKLYSQTRELIVPPEKRVLNVEVQPSSTTCKPGEQATVKLKLTDFFNKPYAGSLVMSVYDKAVEYISGGSNVPEIREFFWKWRRHHAPQTEHNLDRWFSNMTLPGVAGMSNLGVFGEDVVDQPEKQDENGGGKLERKGGGRNRLFSMNASRREVTALCDDGMAVQALSGGMPAVPCASAPLSEQSAKGLGLGDDKASEPEAVAQPVVRREFADTAYWNALITPDSNGVAEVAFKMPENLTGWKIRTWAMGQGTKVGEGDAEVVTAKNLMLRLQAPRFFVQKDEVVLSANVHNYLKSSKKVQAVLELEGGCLQALEGESRDGGISRVTKSIKVGAGGEERVDWRVKVLQEGKALVRMKALTDEESDAMELSFPVYVHGMLKTDSFCGVLRPDRDRADVTLVVPSERRPEQSRLEVRYSPTLAGALVDALPYLVDYPYGCTEQTLNRFLPTVMVQKILSDMGVDLKAIRDKRTNLNAQEVGDDQERAAQWKRNNPPNPGEQRNPVFDEAVVNDMVKQGLKALTAMQCDDGGWGWFSGWGEHSWPHTTAYVVHGLQMAQHNGVAIVPGVLERGLDWLARYQREELEKIRNAPRRKDPWKPHADDLDAFVHMVLVDSGRDNTAMRDQLYEGRTNLSVYALSMVGLSLHKTGQAAKRDMVIRNLGQYLVRDSENQTAYLNLGNSGYWWCWYGSENEAQAYYLKLLAATEPRSEIASELVKYLLNNRKHATYWNSTRDTALCVEALADYLRASGEDKPDMTVEVWLDGKKMKESRITSENLFTFDNKLVLEGAVVPDGRHLLEVRRQGRGPVYFNAYLTNFTLEDPIKRAGLEIKVNRTFYKLLPANKTAKVAGARGQAVDQKVDKDERVPLKEGDALKSGDLVEVELEIASKNDYEYVLFEDMKAAGFEPVEVRSGYNGNDLGAYVEFRDERVGFFVRQLARGQNSVSYRLRAEIPGRFSALPVKASALYAPELKANSDETKLKIE